MCFHLVFYTVRGTLLLLVGMTDPGAFLWNSVRFGYFSFCIRIVFFIFCQCCCNRGASPGTSITLGVPAVPRRLYWCIWLLLLGDLQQPFSNWESVGFVPHYYGQSVFVVASKAPDVKLNFMTRLCTEHSNTPTEIMMHPGTVEHFNSSGGVVSTRTIIMTTQSMNEPDRVPDINICAALRLWMLQRRRT